MGKRLRSLARLAELQAFLEVLVKESMAGKNSRPSIKPEFRCCPSAFGEGEG